ncbi:hypothetical protein BGZ70_005958 [Mortierella alpina]|uniref:Uncharacterized protein n=1 Tax=Mortierella alpina TaxID=64518 RepID=A0A9P6JAJ9_MORAP|nr:hypothetical protein BGZ70_005958 [Mortierella alpina]
MALDFSPPSSMWKIFRGIKVVTMVTLGVSMMATSVVAVTKPVSHFVFAEDGNLTAVADIIRRSDIHGVQMIYNWKQLELSKGHYNFSDIESDLELLKTIDPTKKLFVQVQDRFDAPGNQTKRVPKYLLEEPEYEGGLFMQVSSDTHLPDGWQTKHWVPAVRERFQYLLSNMSYHLDDKIFGVNLPETAFDYDGTLETSLCDAYFDGQMENLRHASAVFKTSVVIQYMNFWPCETLDHHPYMERAFAEAASEKTFGFGGPDVKPWNQFQISNSYQYFHQYRGQLSHVAMAVQSPDLKWPNPKTNKTSTVDDFKSFSQDYLGSDIMFWTSQIFNATYPPPL